jgi:hypothetical protein
MISAMLISDDAHRFVIFCNDSRACCDVTGVVVSRVRNFSVNTSLSGKLFF